MESESSAETDVYRLDTLFSFWRMAFPAAERRYIDSFPTAKGEPETKSNDSLCSYYLHCEVKFH